MNLQEFRTVKHRNNLTSAAAPLVLLAVLASGAWAQAPSYRPPPPPSRHGALEVRLRYTLAPDIGFSGLGTVPFRDSYSSENNLLLGTVRSISYDDGALAQDYIESTLIAGGTEGIDWMPSPDFTATSNFSYTGTGQVDSTGKALLFHRYASEGPADTEFEGDASGAMGWELAYTKYFGRKRNIGLQVGFSHNGFDSRFNQDIDADLITKTFKHEMADGNAVPALPDKETGEDGVETQPPYEGAVSRPDVASDALLEWDATELPAETTIDGVTVNSQADLRSSLYNFRVGPTYNLSLGQRFALQAGAGLNAMFVSGRFAAYEVLNNPGSGDDPGRGLITTEDAEWQVGGYVDASAYYNITQRVNVFSGMQLNTGSTYTQMNEEREARVDFSSQVSIHAGMGIRF